MRTSPNDPKSRPGRCKMLAGAQSDDQGLPQAVPGRSGNAPKPPRNAPGWLRGCAAGTLGGANGVRGASGNPPEGSREAPKAISYAVVDQHAPRSARATFFRRPRCFAQTSRHAFRLSFNGVLTEFDEVRVTHARAAWELAKRSCGHGKSKPGGRPSEPKRPPGLDLTCPSERFARSRAARARVMRTSSNSVRTPLKLSRNACRPVPAKRRSRQKSVAKVLPNA